MSAIATVTATQKKTALHVQGGKIFAQGFNLLQTVFSIGIG
jgi:hypothetical protein